MSSPPPPDTDETIAALELKLKQLRGGKLTQAEQKKLDSYQKRQFDADVREYFQHISKTHYCELAGRQVKSVNEFGERYGIACDEPQVNLYSVIKDFHTLASELYKKAQTNLDLDEIELEREKLKQEIAKLQRQSAVLDIDIQKRMETLVDRVDIVAGLEWLSAKLRALGTRIHSLAGQDGVDAVNEFLDDLSTEMERGGQLHF